MTRAAVATDGAHQVFSSIAASAVTAGAAVRFRRRPTRTRSPPAGASEESAMRSIGMAGSRRNASWIASSRSRIAAMVAARNRCVL